MTTPIFETARFSVHLVSIADAPFILELLNTASWIQYIGKRDVHTVEDAEQYIQERFIAHYQEWGFGVYAVRLKGTATPVGIITLLKKPHLDSPDIGYAFLDVFTGNGFAFEATRGVYNYALSTLGMTRIVAVTLENNERSIKLLKKLGFYFEKTIQQGDIELLLFRNE
jgi:[ribosomal protein S5]-alanine N-acetyltransferase